MKKEKATPSTAEQRLAEEIQMMRATGLYADDQLKRYDTIARGTFGFARDSLGDSLNEVFRSSVFGRVLKRLLKMVRVAQ